MVEVPSLALTMEDSIALAEALTAQAPAGEQEPTAIQRLDRFARQRGPEKDKLLDASRKSYLWYENIGEWMRRYSPFEFIHAFMTRTGRIDEQRLLIDNVEAGIGKALVDEYLQDFRNELLWLVLGTGSATAAGGASAPASASSRRKPSAPTWPTKASRLGPTSGSRTSSIRRS